MRGKFNMNKKILGIGIIIVVIIIIILIVMLFLTKRKEGDKQEIENSTVAESNVNKTNNSQTVEDIINRNYNYMKNKDFQSASKLFDEDEFFSILRQNTRERNIETILKMAYEDYEEFYEYSIRNIRQIEGIDDFKNNTNIDITEKEYQEIFGNYILYLVQIDVDDENVTNGENAIDVYLFAKDNKMVCTIRVMNSYATKGMIGQAKDSKEDVDKSEIKERLLLAISSIRQDIMDNPTLQLKEYCNREVLQNEISRATINEFTWENDIGNGTITNEEGKTYNFTIDSNYQVDVSDVID